MNIVIKTKATGDVLGLKEAIIMRIEDIVDVESVDIIEKENENAENHTTANDS